ncbi:MAG: VIT family protein [Actinobacteria bacterium]|jgi:VIT1/CCC1 family predicted Fe2+/Mn2+ transporter|nr:VIT family protein [Actinomycetota bacterium]MDA2984692.1 VIT family protein [Actinomycetota bacterium]
MPIEDVWERNKDHRTHRAGWLRASVLGANDGLVSISSLMIGITAAGANDFVLTVGLAGIAAGAMSMAVGEYVSVRSQNDIEDADRALETQHLADDPDGELEELTQIYIDRGLTRKLASEVASQLHATDPLRAHLRDELGQFDLTRARPLQAALASGLAFTLGGVIPLVGAFVPTLTGKAFTIVSVTLVGLIIAGIFSGRTAGSSIPRAVLRVVMGGALGMAITAGVGQLFHISGI